MCGAALKAGCVNRTKRAGAQSGRAARCINDPMKTDETRLVVRQNMSYKWLWLLETSDHHVVNRSDVDFANRKECLSDAYLKGFSLS